MASKYHGEMNLAAEAAIQALGRGDSSGARMAVASARDLDDSASFGSFVDAVNLAVSELESSERISESTWDQLADAAGPGTLQAMIEAVRD